MTDCLETIINSVPVAARLEQLAEEAADAQRKAVKLDGQKRANDIHL